jgi:dTDP-4-dehydrorhamnose 3,5-epimerase
MKIYNTKIDGVLIIQPDVFKDDRGYFFESYSLKIFEERRLDLTFIQDNISKSKKGTIRGLHYQIGKSAQGKLCQVISGAVLDVAVDIRFGSPTFGQYVSEILSEDNHNQIWIPPGFAHGFAVLSGEAIFHYKCTNYYNKNDERAILYNDPEVNINWQIETPIVSEKDMKAKRFNQIDKDFEFYKK